MSIATREAIGSPAGAKHTVRGLLELGRAQIASDDEARLDAELLLCHVAGIARSTVLAYPEREIAPDVAERYRGLVKRRAAGEPLAYLVGQRDFHALTLEVTPAVLVPRPESELLVDALLDLVAPGARACVLDLGTGSGALALAIKQVRPRLRVMGTDISAAALDVARANGQRLGLAIEWRQSDWFAALREERFDAVVCNPPYVASGDSHFAGGLRYEPRGALDAGPDGLDAYRAVLGQARPRLAPGAWLLLEHGYDQQESVSALAEAAGYRVAERLRDLAGHPRVLVLQPS